MAKYLAIFEDRTTPEGIELYGLKLFTSKEMSSYEELISSITWEFEFVMMDGSSYVSYPNGEELFSRVTFKLITNEEYTALDGLFDGMFGIFPHEDFLTDILGGADSEDRTVYDDYDDDYTDE